MSKIIEQKEAFVSLKDLQNGNIVPKSYPTAIATDATKIVQYTLTNDTHVYLASFPRVSGKQVLEIFNGATRHPSDLVSARVYLADYNLGYQAISAKERGVQNEATRLIDAHLTSPLIGKSFADSLIEIPLYFTEAENAYFKSPIEKRVIVADLDKYTRWFYSYAQDNDNSAFAIIKGRIIVDHSIDFLRFIHAPEDKVSELERLDTLRKQIGPNQDTTKEKYFKLRDTLLGRWTYQKNPKVSKQFKDFFLQLALEKRVGLLTATVEASFLDPTTGQNFLGRFEGFTTSYTDNKLTIGQERNTSTLTLSEKPDSQSGRYTIQSVETIENPFYDKDGLQPVVAWIERRGRIRLLSPQLTRHLAQESTAVNGLGRAVIAGMSQDVKGHMPTSLPLEHNGVKNGIGGVQTLAVLFGPKYSRRLAKQPILKLLVNVFEQPKHYPK